MYFLIGLFFSILAVLVLTTIFNIGTLYVLFFVVVALLAFAFLGDYILDFIEWVIDQMRGKNGR